jgi:hypothetical protein
LNYAEHTKSISFYIKQRQEKTECGVSGREVEREREREREADQGSERWSIGENLKRRGLRNDRLK